jgi:enamine deaminase RidA (YjgF/YER057c/UK114 family)|tara:strand:+ start:3717 stop:4019 length:303 start_codon:yes stop_codon:yes gene_type:complete
MSLTDEFFIQRGQKINALIEQGYINIDELAKTAGITVDQLIQAQYLSQRNIQSTADLYNVSVTQLGQPFLKEIKSRDLIVVKPNRLNSLINAINKAGTPE